MDAQRTPLTSAADVGRLVRETRKHQGLTQTDLAVASGTGVRFVVDVEKGKETVQLGKVLRVLKMLGLVLAASGSDA
ncbi:MAG: helix-turn-helix transcriptional regulator [Planctomycetota bacterium]|nr:helix-turn-helix transcriptional regulator [Planctomycetota bacterium]MCB9824507.1 helix-turn-helix transcriptional regulator [Planctomycetota bacterium]MCB9900504.1 helix-turn-helix transcriptional regulator [Planctomycetota bacterium]